MTFLFWAAAIVVFAIAEATTTALVSIWFAVGAAAAMVASIFTTSLGVQCAVFAVVSAVTLGVMLPLLAKRRTMRQPPITNGSPLTIGSRGIVLRKIPQGGYRPRACGWAGLAGPHGGRHSAAKRCTLRSKKRGRRGTDRIRCSRTGCGTARRTTALRQPAKVPRIV